MQRFQGDVLHRGRQGQGVKGDAIWLSFPDQYLKAGKTEFRPVKAEPGPKRKDK
jgi:hypothetical protein